MDAGTSPADRPNVLGVAAAVRKIRGVEAAWAPEDMEFFSLMVDYVELGSEGSEARMLELFDGSDTALEALRRLEIGALPSPRPPQRRSTRGDWLAWTAIRKPALSIMPRRLDRRLGCGRPAARRILSTASRDVLTS